MEIDSICHILFAKKTICFEPHALISLLTLDEKMGQWWSESIHSLADNGLKVNSFWAQSASSPTSRSLADQPVHRCLQPLAVARGRRRGAVVTEALSMHNATARRYPRRTLLLPPYTCFQKLKCSLLITIFVLPFFVAD